MAADLDLMTDEEVIRIFKSNCVSYTGNFEVTPGQALRIAKLLGNEVRQECARACATDYRTPDGWGITGADARCEALILSMIVPV